MCEVEGVELGDRFTACAAKLPRRSSCFKKMLIFLECSVSTFNLFLEKIKYCLTSVAQAAAADLYNADKEFKD